MPSDPSPLVFGWRTALMAMAGLQLLLLAAALAAAERNRTANRLLAALLAVLVGLMTPYGIGFAGFYDRWPWLSFAPFGWPLALGPLIWAYTFTLTHSARPPRLALHFAPAALHLIYGMVCFLQPLQVKYVWAEQVHDVWIDPVISAATLGGLAAYCLAAARLLSRYRAALERERSDAPRYAAAWLSRALIAMIAALTVWSGYQAVELGVGRLSYFQMFGLYLVLAATGLYLGIEGWRHASLAFPGLLGQPASVPPVTAPARDWAAQGAAWARETAEGGWWRDEDLTLAGLAAKLGTNTSHLSRALNEGLSVNFATFVNGLRAEAVARALDDGAAGDLLDLAFDAGFASKASFNRAFRARFGSSPSDYRRQHGSKDKNSSENWELRRAAD